MPYMPQINLYTYLSSCSWTIILLYTFYYCMKQYFLPRIYESIRIKKLLVNNNITKANAETSNKKSGNGLVGYDYYYNIYNNFLSK